MSEEENCLPQSYSVWKEVNAAANYKKLAYWVSMSYSICLVQQEMHLYDSLPSKENKETGDPQHYEIASEDNMSVGICVCFYSCFNFQCVTVSKIY